MGQKRGRPLPWWLKHCCGLQMEAQWSSSFIVYYWLAKGGSRDVQGRNMHCLFCTRAHLYHGDHWLIIVHLFFNHCNAFASHLSLWATNFLSKLCLVFNTFKVFWWPCLWQCQNILCIIIGWPMQPFSIFSASNSRPGQSYGRPGQPFSRTEEGQSLHTLCKGGINHMLIAEQFKSCGHSNYIQWRENCWKNSLSMIAEINHDGMKPLTTSNLFPLVAQFYIKLSKYAGIRPYSTQAKSLY